MCINKVALFCRYYVAEGVRIYSQDTWKQVAGDGGKELVEKYIQQVVRATTNSSSCLVCFKCLGFI